MGEGVVGEGDVLVPVEHQHALGDGVQGGAHALGDHLGPVGVGVAQDGPQVEVRRQEAAHQDEHRQGENGAEEEGEGARPQRPEAQLHHPPGPAVEGDGDANVGRRGPRLGAGFPGPPVVADLDEQLARRAAEADGLEVRVALGNGAHRCLGQGQLFLLHGEGAFDGQRLAQDFPPLEDGAVAVGEQAQRVGGGQDADHKADDAEADSHHEIVLPGGRDANAVFLPSLLDLHSPP